MNIKTRIIKIRINMLQKLKFDLYNPNSDFKNPNLDYKNKPNLDPKIRIFKEIICILMIKIWVFHILFGFWKFGFSNPDFYNYNLDFNHIIWILKHFIWLLEIRVSKSGF